MDAVEYLKAKIRMCRAMDCVKCQACRNENPIGVKVEVVEKWAKEHPVATYKSEFMKLFPNVSVDRDGNPSICLEVLGVEIQEKSNCWDAEFKGWS